jgi:molybdate transport system substrate-binding protein
MKPNKTSYHFNLSVLLMLSMLVCSGCSSARDEAPLTIAAAASLTATFKDIGEAFTEETGIPVVFSFASTGHLAQQIRNGGPFDLFAAADAAHIDSLIEDGFLEAGTRTVFAHGRLVMLTDRSSAVEIEAIEDLFDPAVTRIAIANPDHAPYGLAARQALERTGLWLHLQPKIVYGETVRQAAQMVETGNVSVGLVALSSVTMEKENTIDIPADLYDPIEHVIAVHRGSARQAEAQRFIAFLSSPRGMAVLKTYGFEIPEGR